MTAQISLKDYIILFCLLKSWILYGSFDLVFEIGLPFIQRFSKHILIFEALLIVKDLFCFVRENFGYLIDWVLGNALALDSMNPESISNFIYLR